MVWGNLNISAFLFIHDIYDYRRGNSFNYLILTWGKGISAYFYLVQHLHIVYYTETYIVINECSSFSNGLTMMVSPNYKVIFLP